MRVKRGIGIVDTDTNRCFCIKSCGRSNVRKYWPKDIAGVAHWRDFIGDSKCRRKVRKHPRMWVPQIRMTANRRHICRADTRQAMAPELRIGDNLCSSTLKSWISGELIVQLGTNVQAAHHFRRSGQCEIGFDRIIGRDDFGGVLMFVIKDRRGKRSVRRQQRSTSTVGGDRNGINAVITVKCCQSVQQKRPMPVDVVMRPWRA